MGPIIPIIVVTALGYFLVKKSGLVIPPFPSAAIIPEIQGQKIPSPTKYAKGALPASVPQGGTSIPLDAPFYLFPFQFSKGTATIYGYWVAVSASDPNSWVSYGASVTNGVQTQKTIIASNGDKNTTARIAYFQNLKLTA
jgi:hypothetical protein